MSRPAVLAPAARKEMREAVAWLSRDNVVVAEALRATIGRAVRMIGDHPQIGQVRIDVAPETYRFWSLTDFPLCSCLHRSD